MNSLLQMMDKTSNDAVNSDTPKHKIIDILDDILFHFEDTDACKLMLVERLYMAATDQEI